VSVAAPRPHDDEGSINYDTPSLKVFIIPVPCADEASGRHYTEAVSVTVANEMRSGCGGALLPADSLAGTSWMFVEIAGQATELTGDLLRDSQFMIDFGIDGFVGYGGCNRFSAGYSQSADMMTTRPPWGRTVGNCGEPVTSRETRLLHILSEPVRISHPDPETMVLTGASGAIRLRRVQSH